jgi:hypothetical protein
MTTNDQPSPYFQKIQQMVQMQYDLSITLAGENWLLDPKVDTTSAMQKEADELIESAGYVPWWVKTEAKVDAENCKTEVVDLWHFLMQGCLQEAARGGVPAAELVECVTTNLDDAYQEFLKGPSITFGLTNVRLTQRWLSMVLLNGMPMDSLRMFWEMADRFGLSLDDLYGRYFAKNTLNRFRRMANYKGDKADMPAYVKLWDGEHEDNWHVLRYVEHTNGNVDDLLEVMAMIYKHYTGIEVMAVDTEKLQTLLPVHYMLQLSRNAL